MAALKLTPEQADFFAQRLAWKAEALMEGADGGDLVALSEQLAPLGELMQELTRDRKLIDAEKLRPLALEAIKETREAIGYETISLKLCKAGSSRHLHDPGDPDAKRKSEATYRRQIKGVTQEGFLAQVVFEAIRDGEPEAVTI